MLPSASAAASHASAPAATMNGGSTAAAQARRMRPAALLPQQRGAAAGAAGVVVVARATRPSSPSSAGAGSGASGSSPPSSFAVQQHHQQQPSTVASAASAAASAQAHVVVRSSGSSSTSPSALLSSAPASAPPTPASALTELGWQQDLASRYILGSTLGGGSYGVVYLAIDRQTGEEVAVKAMSKRRPKSTRERTLKKLVREAALQARVQHCSGVVKLLGAYEDAECAYLVMERLRGGDLDQALASGGPLSERAAAAVAHECLKVVATCHAAGVMHGDVKPANFMLREAFSASSSSSPSTSSSSDSGEPATVIPASTATIESLVEGGNRPPARWLAAVDFGCAQPLGRASLNRRTGTPVYMAPEVFQRDYGREADLWSAGVMLYQLLSGRFPFWRSLDDCRSRSVDEVMRSVLGDPVPLSGGVWAGKSAACVDLLAGLLDRDPGSRLTAADALEHPWFREQLGGVAAVASTSTSAATSESNIVPMAGSHDHDGHYRPAATSPAPMMRPHAFSPSSSSPAVAPACAWYAPGPSGMAVA